MPLHGADSTDSWLLPGGLAIYLPYRDGLYANEGAVRARFPHATIIPITVRNGNAPCDDIEPGNGGPADAPGYVEHERHQAECQTLLRGVPMAYADRADTAAIVGYLERAGLLNSAWLWVAHPDGIPHICTAARCGFNLPDARIAGTQYAWNPNGVNIDLSLFKDGIFGSVPHVDPYAIFLDKVFAFGRLKLNERGTVKQVDAALKQPKKNHSLLVAQYGYEHLFRERMWNVAKRLDPLPNGNANWAGGRGERWHGHNDRMNRIVKATGLKVR